MLNTTLEIVMFESMVMSSDWSDPLAITRPGFTVPSTVLPKVTLRLAMPLMLRPTLPARVNWLVAPL